MNIVVRLHGVHPVETYENACEQAYKNKDTRNYLPGMTMDHGVEARDCIDCTMSASKGNGGEQSSAALTGCVSKCSGYWSPSPSNI